MLSRVIRVLIVFAVVALVLFVPLRLLEPRRTPEWRAELSWYLWHSDIPGEGIQRVDVAEAQHPGQFAPQLLRAMPTGWAWSGIARIPRPEMVQCVRIERQKPAGRTATWLMHREYFLIGYHNDGQWRAGWLLHEFREGVSEEEQQAVLDKLGCTNWVKILTRPLSRPSNRNLPTVVQTPNAIELFETQTAPTLTPTAVPARRSDPTAEPTPHERYFPTFVAPLSAELRVP